MSTDPDEPRDGQISADPETVRQWAAESNAVPVESPTGKIQILTEESVDESDERVDWDRLLAEIEEDDRVLVYYGEEDPEPFKILDRETAVEHTELTREEIEKQLLSGETVTSEVTETTVVESVVTEEATVESELVDSEVVDQSLLDVDLIQRECTSCEISPDQETGEFDVERYFDSLDRTTRTGSTAEHESVTDDDPIEAGEQDEIAVEDTYHATLELEETWAVTWQLAERFTVESRITDTEVSGSDTVESQEIDVDGLQRAIAEEDLLDLNMAAEDVLAQCDVQTEFREGDRAHTYFTRQQVFEDEVVDRKRLDAEATGGQLLGMKKTSQQTVGTEFTDDEDMEPTATADQDVESAATTHQDVESTATADRDAESAAAGDEEGVPTAGIGERPEQTAEESYNPPEGPGKQQPSVEGEQAAVDLSRDDLDSTVIDAEGDAVGTVTEIDASGDVLFVEPEQSLTEQIKAALDWGEAGEEDYSLHVEQIESTTDDEVHLKPREKLNR